MKQKETVAETGIERMRNGAGLSGELLRGEASLYMIGKKRLIVENMKGIRSFQQDCLCLALREGQLRICGEKLMIGSYTKDSVEVSGLIRSLFYE